MIKKPSVFIGLAEIAGYYNNLNSGLREIGFETYFYFASSQNVLMPSCYQLLDLKQIDRILPALFHNPSFCYLLGMGLQLLKSIP